MRSTQLLIYAFAAGLSAAALTAAPEAMARSASFSRTINTPKGTFTQTGTASFNPATGVANGVKTTTGPKGATQTLSYASAPDGKGGLVVTRSFTSFRGKTHTFTRRIGP